MTPSSAEDGHVFDWAAGTTSDPRFRPLQGGDQAPRVFCDGVEQGGEVRRCRTGPDGYVILQCLDANGEPIINEAGDGVKERTIDGRVVVTPPAGADSAEAVEK